MMFGFGLLIAFEMGEPAVGGAVGVTHHEDPLGLVQANRHTDLFEDEVLLEIITRRGESFGAARDNDHVGALDTLLLQELSNGSVDAMVEAAEHGGVGYVGVRGGVEMADLILAASNSRLVQPHRRRFLFRRTILPTQETGTKPSKQINNPIATKPGG